MKNPGDDARIASGDNHAIVSKKGNELLAAKNTYHTQEGVEAALRDLIVDNVPEAAIVELKDETFGYANVAPLDLLQHLKANAETVDVNIIGDMLRERDVPLDFEGEESLKTQFARIEKVIKELKEHGITTSHTSLMATYLINIQGHGGEFLRVAFNEWCAMKATVKSWTKFKAHFSEADKLRRQALKASGGVHGKAAQRESANHIKDMDEKMTAMFAAGMSTMAEAAEESINAAIESKFKSIKSDKDENDVNSLLKGQIRSLEKQLKDLQGKSNDGNNGNNDGGGGRTRTNPNPKCSHCGRKHGGNICFMKSKENWDKAPEFYKKRNPWKDE